MYHDLHAGTDDTGVSPRTVYFYVQQGLLPPAEGAGRGAKYSQVHRDRLRLIRQLQDQHLPLAEIRKRIDALSKQELTRLAGSAGTPTRTSSSAAEYIRSVLAGQGTPEAPRRGTPSHARISPSAHAAHGTPGERSQWERISLAPELELHVRRPLSRVMNRKLEQLLEFARALMKEPT